MRVVVLGVGAVGGWLAAGLARGGAEVSLLARGATLVALRRDGLVLLEGERETCFRLPATDDAASIAGADALLLGLKGHDVAAALPSILAARGPRSLIVPVLNGLPWWFFQGFPGPAEGLVLDSVDPGGALARALPVTCVLGGVAHVASRVEAPGRVRVAKSDRLLLGDPGGDAARAAPLAALCNAGALPTSVVPDIRAAAWAKLWGNVTMNPLSALARADMAQLLGDPGVLGMIEAIMQEMAALGELVGLPFGMSVAERLAITRKLGAVRTSMLQDLEAGRALELGPILGSLVELADRLQAPVPLLRAVHGLTRLLALNLGLSRG